MTIDRLCKDLQRTKGAFYHHFADVTVYSDALLAAWEARNTSLAALRGEVHGNRQAARGVIEAAVRGFDVPLERSFRAWGLRDPRVHAFVARIDERRIAFLSTRYAATVPVATRRKLARLEYAVFVGVQQLYPEISAPVARDLERTLAAALVAVVGPPTLSAATHADSGLSPATLAHRAGRRAAPAKSSRIRGKAGFLPR